MSGEREQDLVTVKFEGDIQITAGYRKAVIKNLKVGGTVRAIMLGEERSAPEFRITEITEDEGEGVIVAKVESKARGWR